jgi:hypothetical protein
MSIPREMQICMNCKHFPCMAGDDLAIHTGQLSMQYNLTPDREFPCVTYKAKVRFEPNRALALLEDPK